MFNCATDMFRKKKEKCNCLYDTKIKKSFIRYKQGYKKKTIASQLQCFSLKQLN